MWKWVLIGIAGVLLLIFFLAPVVLFFVRNPGMLFAFIALGLVALTVISVSKQSGQGQGDSK